MKTAIGSMLVVVVGLAFAYGGPSGSRSTPTAEPEFTPESNHVVPTPSPSQPNRPSPAEVRLKLNAAIDKHLGLAAAETARRIGPHMQRIDAFFDRAKTGSRDFAEDALGLHSKWSVVVDKLPFTRTDRSETFLRGKFEEHLFEAVDLERLLEQETKCFVSEIQEIENQMLVRLQTDIGNLPQGVIRLPRTKEELEKNFGEALRRTRAEVGKDLAVDIGQLVASEIASAILVRVLSRVGIRAGIVGAGAVAGPWTLALGFLIDYLVEKIWDLYADSKGQLAAQIDEQLELMETLIVAGDGTNLGLRGEMEKLAARRVEIRRKAVVAALNGQ